MKRWRSRVAVVTGASSGIGAAIVEDLVESGMKVVGLARRQKLLLEMMTRLQGKPGTLYHVNTDITKDDEVKAAFTWIKKDLGSVDVLVNNAGIFIKSKTPEGVIEDWRKMFEVNVFALGSCSREAVNLMKELNINDGHIININSVASHRLPDVPGINPYSSSKFASKAITEALRRELAEEKSNIKVTSISPGLVKTEIFEANAAYTTEEAEKMWTRPHLKPKDIADAVHYVLATPPHVLVSELIVRPLGDVI